MEISYSEAGVTETASFMLSEVYLTGLLVTASYSDNSDDNVTDKCVFSPQG